MYFYLYICLDILLYYYIAAIKFTCQNLMFLVLVLSIPKQHALIVLYNIYGYLSFSVVASVEMLNTQ